MIRLLYRASQAGVKVDLLVRRLKDILNVYLADEAKARCLQPDSTYTRSPRRKEPSAVNAQASFLGPGLPPEHGRVGTTIS